MNSNIIFNLTLICLLVLIVFYSFSFVTSSSSFFLLFQDFKLKMSWPSKNDEENIIAWLQGLLSSNQLGSQNFGQTINSTNSANDHFNNIFIYKYFNHLIEEVMILRKKIGVNVNDSLLEIRLGLEKDFFYERKLKNLFIQFLFQFIFISSIIWINAYLYQTFLDIKFSNLIIYLSHLGPILGILLFILIYFKIHLGLFSPYAIIFKTLYILHLSSQTRLPLSYFSDKLKLLETIENQDKRFATFLPRLNSVFRLSTLEGKSIMKEIEFLKTELWRLWEQDFIQLKFYLNLLKLIFLMIIFLPCFFLLLYGLIEAMQIS